MTSPFLVEIGTEELPPKTLKKLAESFLHFVMTALNNANLSYSDATAFAAPRRFALQINNLAAQQADKQIEKRGPALQAALDSKGQPTKACEGFLRSCQATVEQLEQRDGYVWISSHEKGKTIAELMPVIVQQALQQLPISKRMRWGDHNTEFVRPVHWIVMLYGADIVPATLLGLATDRITYGHRFHHPAAVSLAHAEEYESKLKTAYVVPHFEQRRAQIQQQIQQLAREVNGQVVMDEALLDEVTALVEWPVALRGEFNSQFLKVPQEALISAMQGHQKSFAVVDERHQLLPYFITISNIESRDPQRVIQGNQRVMHARLADAEFFFTTDSKQSLQHYIERLKTVIFQTKLGTLYDKCHRISLLAEKIAVQQNADPLLAKRTAELCKADLMTAMVNEFPELQGIAGYYYAQLAQEPAEVALAIKEHYLPRFAGDELPTTDAGCSVAIADRLDTLVGIFGINQIPTGEKDPFGLRRAALGILRIIIEQDLALDLRQLISTACKHYSSLPNANTAAEVFAFIMERLRNWYSDRQIPADIFNAVAAVNPSSPLDFHHRINAVSQFVQLPEAAALAAANKRVSRILQKEVAETLSTAIDSALFEHEAEHQLATALNKCETTMQAFIEKSDYVAILTQLAKLQLPIDTFFDKVMVMAEDKAKRNNRLALLQQLRALFLIVADISVLQN